MMAVQNWLIAQLTESSWQQEVVHTLDSLLAQGGRRQQGHPAPEALLEGLDNPTLKALLLWHLLQKVQTSVIVVCPDPQSVTRLQVAFEALLGKEQAHHLLLRYPTEFFSPYDLAVLPTPFLREHYQFLQACKLGQAARLGLVSARNLLVRFPTLSEREQQGMTLLQDQDIAPEDVVTHCLAMGYTSTSLVLEAGDVSRRGDIVDIYPVNGEPVRLSFFGDTIEAIRQMDADTQRSVAALEQVAILPRSTLVLTEGAKATLNDELPERLQALSKKLSTQPGGGGDLEGLAVTISSQLQGLDQDFHADGLDYYAPLIHDQWTSLGDSLPEGCLLVLEDWASITNQVEALGDRLGRQLADDIKRGRLLPLGSPWHLDAAEALGGLQAKPNARLLLEPFGGPVTEANAEGLTRLPTLKQEGVPRFQANLANAVEQMAQWRRDGFQTVIATDYPQRLLDICKENDVSAEYWPENTDKPKALQQHESGRFLGVPVVITKQVFADGFFLPDLQLVYLTDAELFGRHRARRVVAEVKGRKKDDPEVIQSLNQLRPGDYVVHIKHGIGQFIEMSRIKLDGEVREYLTLQYKGKDKLHVPVDQLNLLSRYRGAGDAKPVLSKIGGAEWQRVQKKVKKSIQNIAKELVQLYSARQRVRGFTFDPDSPWQVELEEAFPFQETPDQWKAISETKSDMEAEKPMDRLICGDVGFGKTEVALRAVFKAVLSGKQAAVLVPTTILAQQHFNTFSERYKPFPVRVGLLSRFRSPAEQKELVERLAAGECDVVVGTHRLLQKDIRFKDLGLLVIDEEHRFGVGHKEKIKHMRTQVDVLTMSATPIPRTLYMSLSGVREMTLINTPPVNRLPVQTFVGPKNPAQMRMAILHEIDRGGQVYYLHNRVNSIYAVADALKELVPEARIAIAHGQMNPRDLESIMLDFSNHAFDVLVCTTIVESGVDIPNANTLIIDDADRYGLAQLYQIRGRVGRSDTQAYAFLYYEPEKMLTEDTKNRLRAIREFTALGSGYQIAMRDMEIRGVGNILGGEQHGHMIQVGFDMYCELLNQAIDAAHKGLDEPEEAQEPSVIDLNVTALIPENYVGHRDVKLNEYKRLANTRSEKALDVIEAEWKDRFGPIPKETERLLQLTRLRIQATELSIPLVRSDDEYLRISVPYNLQEWMGLQRDLPPKIGKKLRWVAGVKSLESSYPTLLCKHLGMDSADMVHFVAELFKSLLKLRYPKAAV